MRTKICRGKYCLEKRRPQAIDLFTKDVRESDGFARICRVCSQLSASRSRAKYGRADQRSAAPEEKTYDRNIVRNTIYLITAAQNNTLVHKGFFTALKQAKKFYKAELIVVPFRYKNPTGLQPGRDLRECAKGRGFGIRCRRFRNHEGVCSAVPDPLHELWWDPVLKPYLLNTRKQLHKHLILAADVKIQPTAMSPLSGFEALTGEESCIIGHPKLQFRSVAVGADGYPKILTTTGVCTKRNYSNTKAGALGEFHYTLGAVLVELDGRRFHIRQLGGNRHDGSFTHLTDHFTATGREKALPAEALILGDVHKRIFDPGVDSATFGPGGMTEILKPKTLIVHDVLDGETVNPHELGDPFLQNAKRKAGRQEILPEIQEVVDFLNARTEGEVVLVDSNHHDFLRRWVLRQFTHGCDDLKNAMVFLESAQHMLTSGRMTPGGAVYGDPFKYWLQKLGIKATVRCLEPDESFRVMDIECGMHGHNGPNGAPGSMRNLARIGTRSVTGHRHFPGIEEGHWSVGTSTPRRQNYHRGPGNNLNTHCVIYASGKRCLLTIIDGHWRA